MTFNQVLKEYSPDIPLKKWNNAQRDTWKKLVNKGEVGENDMNSFTRFAKFFDNYYKKNKHFPSIKEVERVL
jgi:hypothetical protein